MQNGYLRMFLLILISRYREMIDLNEKQDIFLLNNKIVKKK